MGGPDVASEETIETSVIVEVDQVAWFSFEQHIMQKWKKDTEANGVKVFQPFNQIMNCLFEMDDSLYIK